ncbi:Histidine kinase [Nonomuraea solani]|uniref:histidine kinase n=1 Tax=Nonomuraea solani TaxID=1144553 RepID=A0A1H6DVW4_9ACTN|nr:sensor histidine kinase [Nonomuraea solani]SEG88873.1 Histidine kinase [Nonomuraea solani]
MLNGAPPAIQRLSKINATIADTALALFLIVTSWLWALAEPDQGRLPADPPSLALILLVNAPLAARRRVPYLVLVVSVSGAVVYHLLGYHRGLNSMGPLLALYTVAAHRPLRAAFACSVPVIAEWTHASSLAPGVAVWSALGQALVVAGCAVSIGASVRLLDTRTRQLAELADRLHQEQEAAAHRAVTLERMQIARELHDVVAHHMSVISVQAGLGRYVAFSEPETARQTLDVIARTSSAALTEMRRLLSILRVEPAGEDEELYTTTPGLERLPALVERMRLAGLSIDMTVEGTARPLPPGLDLCAFRIVQEALTNVLKHAGDDARVRIVVTYDPDDLALRITDDGHGTPAAAPGGHGLLGMAERVRLYHGTITAGPLPQGGYEVAASFPL